jgi:hypothetical protein
MARAESMSLMEGIDSRFADRPAGVPTVVFGPGSINQAHTADEWLSLDELSKARDALYAFLAKRRRAGVTVLAASRGSQDLPFLVSRSAMA